MGEIKEFIKTRGFGEKLRKNKFLIILVVIALIIMLLPTGRSEKKDTEVIITPTVRFSPEAEEARLGEILSRIDGAGTVKVYLSYSGSERRILAESTQEDRDDGKFERSMEPILKSCSDGETEIELEYENPCCIGAVAVFEGKDDPSVELAVINAIKTATGLGVNQISTAKMESNQEEQK